MSDKLRNMFRQGGMGVDISSPKLANAVAQNGGLGTVSGVFAEGIVARILQAGDPDGDIRRALANFPFKKFADRVLETYFVDGGKPPNKQYVTLPSFTLKTPESLIALIVCANFAFVWLAKEGHNFPIAVNYLEKVQRTHVYALTGAMLAGVDTVTMGAGLPRQIPAVLDTIASGGNPTYSVDVARSREPAHIEFDPTDFFGTSLAGLKRPDFIPIVTTDTTAAIVKKLSKGSIQGFVIERPNAGGHNAPPRGGITLDARGEPVYGDRDHANFAKMRELGLPFWIGGGLASPEGLAWALEQGAEGIQVGSIMALARESGMRDDIRSAALACIFDGNACVRTSLTASPTGFPFKLADIPGSDAELEKSACRRPQCTHGVLLQPFLAEDGDAHMRCPAEPVAHFAEKGGDTTQCDGVICLCNSLIAMTPWSDEGAPATVTLGDDLSFVRKLLAHKNDSYGVADALCYLRG